MKNKYDDEHEVGRNPEQKQANNRFFAQKVNWRHNKKLKQVVLSFSGLLLLCNIFQTVLNQNKNTTSKQRQMCI